MKHGVGLLALVALVAGCGEKELILSGDRYSPREVLQAPEPDAEAQGSFAPETEPANQTAPLPAGSAVANAEWTQRGGNARHGGGNLALGGALTRVWSASIGTGDNRRRRLSADPVVGAGRVYVMDSAAQVSAFSTGGARQWVRDLAPGADRGLDASGGGLSFGDGKVFVTTGFGDVAALDAASGATLWTHRADDQIAAAPTYGDGVVYLVASNGTALALDAATGRERWAVRNAASRGTVMAGGGPAIDGPRVVMPTAAAQIAAIDRDTGAGVWRTGLGGARPGRAAALFTGISGDPVVAGDIIIAANPSGEVAALNAATGERVWSVAEGATGPLWVAGGSVFFVTDTNRLMRLDAGTGAKVWAIDLPLYTRTRDKRRREVFVHFGPVLAGGRLVLASSDGLIRSFDPASGADLGAVELPGGAGSHVAVAGGTLYVVSGNGELQAFR